MQTLDVSKPQLQSAFEGRQLTAKSTLPAPQRQAVITRAIFGNKQKQPSLTKAKYDKSGFEADTPTSAFTRRREVIVGRAAMSGFISAVIGELLTGRGALGQLQLETKLPPIAIDLFTAGIVGFNFVTALGPGSATFSEQNQADVKKRGKGPTQKPSKINPISEPKKFFGIDSRGFGFTKTNELFVGRVAMLGFASEIVGEKLSGGKGPLGQLGLPVTAATSGYEGFALLIWVGFFLVAAIGYGNYGEQEGSEDVY